VKQNRPSRGWGEIFAGFDDGPSLVNGINKTPTLPAGAYAILREAHTHVRARKPQSTRW
jgi:hypothetical protein